MSLVDRIRVLANREGMSLPDLEIKLGMGNGTISRWNKNKPNSDKLITIADYFNVSLDFLMGRVGDEKEILENQNQTSPITYENMITVYTRGKNNLTPQEKMKLAQIILSEED